MIPIRNDVSMTMPAVSHHPLSVAPSAARGDARLSQAEYEGWLLPPEPREGIERVVHALSLAAGIGALTIFSAGLWLVA